MSNPARPLTRPQANTAAVRLKVYAHPQRLMILTSLLGSERSVGEIETVTAIAQPTLSQQLAALRRAELVRTRREAKQIFYRLADDKTTFCVRSISSMFGDTGAMPGSLA
jgi:DNA-binding transcriptional ArsR family regulator